MPWLMHAAARGDSGTEELELLGGAIVDAPVEISGVPCGLASSFFHTRHLNARFEIFEVGCRRLGGRLDSEARR